MDENRPRHSYLPGICLPLYPEDWLMKNPAEDRANAINEKEWVLIPILPVVSVFLFPGSRLPLRIRQKTWAEYISNAIRDIRKRNSSQQVRIGIVTLVRGQGVITIDERGGLVGKIGTFATVTYTHEQESTMNENPQSSVQGHVEEGEIIITVIGTGRFRIVSKVEQNTNRSLPMYNVTVLDDEQGFSVPQEIKYRPTVQENVKLLSSISSVPSVAYNVVWPWTLVEQIVSDMMENKAFEGFRNLPPSSGYVSSVDKNEVKKQRTNDADPMAFSFWLAAKLPMSEEDRINLLEKTCTVERLLFIRKLVRSQDKVKLGYARCASCNSKIGRLCDIFTVEGADGANGAYVNPHGIIHQTWTLRQICENSVFTVGEAEIQDSWFPGYSWTIAHCANCFSHLGWKFSQVSASLQGFSNLSTYDCRPYAFWGISGANINMFSQ